MPKGWLIDTERKGRLKFFYFFFLSGLLYFHAVFFSKQFINKNPFKEIG